MNNPQDRIIKKMIDNIVEKNKPAFEKPGSAAAETSPAVSTASSAVSTEDSSMILRKIEYGFNVMRQEHADLRKQIEELSGAVKMLRNDFDQVRMAMQRSRQEEQRAPSHAQQQSSHSVGAPQYRKTEADEAYERDSGSPSHEGEHAPQARGFAKKEQTPEVDISKVFYYGKK